MFGVHPHRLVSGQKEEKEGKSREHKRLATTKARQGISSSKTENFRQESLTSGNAPEYETIFKRGKEKNGQDGKIRSCTGKKR